MEGSAARWFFRLMTLFVLAFLYIPLAIVVLYAFNKTRTASWPPDLWTTEWFSQAWQDPSLKPALFNSIKAGIAATTLALILGTLASFAVHRFRFFGRNTISFALVLPIALPGIVTALALRTRWSKRCPSSASGCRRSSSVMPPSASWWSSTT